MMNEKLKNIVEALIRKTRSKEAIWNRSSASNQFKLLLPNNIAVTITLFSDNSNQNSSLVIAIYNENGDVIHSYDTEYEDDDSKAGYAMLQTLYRAASDLYYKVDETFDALLQSVNSTGVIGTSPNKTNDGDDLPF
jgi:hypothetical protein